MGKIFLDHIGGQKLYSCAACETNLTNKRELISTRFTGATGRAYLFKRVVNLTYSQVQDRVMLTGRHMVRDVMCKNCKAKLGWMYEFATEESQKWVSLLDMYIFLCLDVNWIFFFIGIRRAVSFWSTRSLPSPRVFRNRDPSCSIRSSFRLVSTLCNIRFRVRCVNERGFPFFYYTPIIIVSF